MAQVLTAEHLFDGESIYQNHALVVEEGRVISVLPAEDAPPADQHFTGLIAPAFLDLQVNGGGGFQLSASTDLAELKAICEAHQRLGSVGVLPTLITDTPSVTASVVAAGIEAARIGLPGFLGLHLEGPHLDPRRKGAHDPGLIRPMTEQDLDFYCEAARDLPVLMITLAPESATAAQIAALREAGVLVSLGHSDCSYEEARAAFDAGAEVATHLFNAMSGLTPRSPGLTGAVLSGSCYAGLIADGVHSHEAALKTALAARPEGLFLVTDCMAFAGTDLREIMLNGRRILRQDGRLTLEDGTLAGADLTLDQAVARLITRLGIRPERALAMASAVPAKLIGRAGDFGALRPGSRACFVELDAHWQLRARFGF